MNGIFPPKKAKLYDEKIPFNVTSFPVKTRSEDYA